MAARKVALRQPSRRLGSITTNKSQSQLQSPAGGMKTANNTLLRGQKSPSTQSTAGSKRKERDYDHTATATTTASTAAEDTSIHVAVRCRGRNDREVKENSGVVVATEGVKGKSVELSMGPNAVSNKAYYFDKVFSPAADQAIVYEEVVAPILNEMLSGYNCTIFAYGQTGTGKTYTMSGDMTDTLGLLSDNAGIIPRVLYSLFRKLEDTESSVKCSFIELYNEELRDLISPEDNPKLKIFENEPKKGHNGSTLVQGMEETYIDSASSGIKLLQTGSYKRQVAATKCNDLSSRGHTIFTITTYVKRATESGEEYISSGKLNLVDLAGSENIQRSGADNKRAAEAGLINKSLLTLGRVINALVDKSPHIPYRESKLTRLLQDSLGGQTKTCIIATVSPARSNLEETISTLDYAFRAKNIRNKPQINPTMSKKTLLREFTTEIEKLKSELIATRHRNGVYLTAETYEEMTMESESRRIVNEEQRAKIETMEASLRNKVQELFTLTSNFNNLKKDNEETRTTLSQTHDILDKTEIVLKDTKHQLEQEEVLRKAHQETEGALHGIGEQLLSTLSQTVEHVDGLHSKLHRKSDLHKTNREIWQASRSEVLDVTDLVDEKLGAFQSKHSILLTDVSTKLGQFFETELGRIQSSHLRLGDFTSSLDQVEAKVKAQNSHACEKMNDVLEEIKNLREDVKAKVGEGLYGLSLAAARISTEIINEMSEFHTQLHSSYGSLGQDFKAMFENVIEHLETQKAEANDLRTQLQEANRSTTAASQAASSTLQQVLEEEREKMEAERAELLLKIQVLMEETSQKQTTRLRGKIDSIRTDISSSGANLEQMGSKHSERMGEWTRREDEFIQQVTESKENLKSRMQDDWAVIDEKTASINRATESIHEETVRIVDTQIRDMATQMEALDDFVTKARSQNGHCHETSLENLQNLTADVRESYTNLHGHLTNANDRIRSFQNDVIQHNDVVRESMKPLEEDIRKPLTQLQTAVRNASFTEYKATGNSPPRTTYMYPMVLPQTESHGALIAKLGSLKQRTLSSLDGEDLSTPLGSPSKTRVYNDAGNEVRTLQPTTTAITSSNTGLREVDVNVVARLANFSTGPHLVDFLALKSANVDAEERSAKEDDMGPPPRKKHLPSAAPESKLPQKAITRRMAGFLEGRENAPLPSNGLNGRKLRSRPSG